MEEKIRFKTSVISKDGTENTVYIGTFDSMTEAMNAVFAWKAFSGTESKWTRSITVVYGD